MSTFILEGPDGSGKTTLLEALKAADSMLETVHPGKPPLSYPSLLAMLNAQLTYNTPYRLVYDRVTCISEWVYRPFRVSIQSDVENECAVYFSLLESQMTLALHVKWPIIYCRPPLSKILAQCSQYNENDTDATIKVVTDHIIDVVYRYDALMARLELFGCKVIIFDYTRHSTDEIIKSMLEL